MGNDIKHTNKFVGNAFFHTFAVKNEAIMSERVFRRKQKELETSNAVSKNKIDKYPKQYNKMKSLKILIVFVLSVLCSCDSNIHSELAIKLNDIRSKYPTWESNYIAQQEIQKEVHAYLNSYIGKNFNPLANAPLEVCDLFVEYGVWMKLKDTRNKVSVFVRMLHVPKEVSLSLYRGEQVYITGRLKDFSDKAGELSGDGYFRGFTITMDYGSIIPLE